MPRAKAPAKTEKTETKYQKLKRLAAEAEETKPEETPAPAAEKMPDPHPAFTNPKAYIGDVVRYWKSGNPNDEATPAVVTHVNDAGDGSITMTAFPRQSELPLPIGVTVLHRDDPRLKENPRLARNGCWDLTQRDIVINEIISI